MEWEFVAMVAPVVAGLVGVWVNLNSTVARLKSRVRTTSKPFIEMNILGKSYPIIWFEPLWKNNLTTSTNMCGMPLRRNSLIALMTLNSYG